MLRTKKPHFSLIIISLGTSMIMFSLQKKNKNKHLLFNILSFQNVLKKPAKLRLSVLINFVLIKKKCVPPEKKISKSFIKIGPDLA